MQHQPTRKSAQNSFKNPSTFPFGLRNMATSYQALLQGSDSSVQRIPLIGAQNGLVLTITPQDFIIHWSGSTLEHIVPD
jgi:hypothetical protein